MRQAMRQLRTRTGYDRREECLPVLRTGQKFLGDFLRRCCTVGPSRREKRGIVKLVASVLGSKSLNTGPVGTTPVLAGGSFLYLRESIGVKLPLV